VVVVVAWRGVAGLIDWLVGGQGSGGSLVAKIRRQALNWVVAADAVE